MSESQADRLQLDEDLVIDVGSYVRAATQALDGPSDEASDGPADGGYEEALDRARRLGAQLRTRRLSPEFLDLVETADAGTDGSALAPQDVDGMIRAMVGDDADDGGDGTDDAADGGDDTASEDDAGRTATPRLPDGTDAGTDDGSGPAPAAGETAPHPDRAARTGHRPSGRRSSGEAGESRRRSAARGSGRARHAARRRRRLPVLLAVPAALLVAAGAACAALVLVMPALA